MALNRTARRPGTRLYLAALAAWGMMGPAGAYEIKDDREVSSRKPVQIGSDQMTYNRLKSLIQYKGNVVATHDKVVLTADEVRALTGNGEASAIGSVKVADSDAAMTMTCGNLEYRDRMNTITAHDHPLLTASNTKSGPLTIRSRQMELYSDKKEVVANQSVEIIDQGGRAQADKATFVSKEDKMILEDDPQVFTPQGEIRGRRIISFMGKSRSVFVEGMAEAVFYSPGQGPVTPSSNAKQEPPEKKSPVAPLSPGP